MVPRSPRSHLETYPPSEELAVSAAVPPVEPPEAPSAEVVLEVRDVAKSYDTNLVLSGVSLTARRGEILGLLGSNGAGKSTLLKIVAGIVAPDSGSLAVSGRPVELGHYSPRDSARLGVHSVQQELSVFTNLSVAENFAMVLEGRHTRRAARSFAAAALDKIFPEPGISVRAETSSLTLAERQMVEIAVAASRPGLSILIMDEPTSALPAHRAEQLHTYLHQLKQDGVLVIYVTHKLDEIVDIADRAVVLRDGRLHWEGDPSKVTRAELLERLGGAAEKDVDEDAVQLPESAEQVDSAEEIEHAVLLHAQGHPCESNGVPFRVRAGEVVGLAGLESAGQRALLREAFARRKSRRSRIVASGGVSYVSGDRKREGIFALWGLRENITISSMAALSRLGWISRRADTALAQEWYDGLSVNATGLEAPIVGLSGGNQQKAVIARGIASGAAVVLLDDPTRGVDIETKTEFYSILRALREQGRGAVLYSTEDREFSECDRVYVMARGSIVKELRGEEITKENIIQWSYAGTGATTRAETTTLRSRSSMLTKPIRSRLALVTVLLAAVVLAMGLTQPTTLSTSGLDLLMAAGLPLVCAALAQLFVILAGDFDVGVGYSIGLANVICATLLVSHPLVGALALVALVVAYAVMATISHLTGVPAIVITLGASFVWLGVGLTLQDVPGGSSPGWLTSMFTAATGSVPEPIYVAAGLALVTFLMLRRWRYGTVLRAFGNNRQSFADTGRSGLLARIVLYMFAGICVVFGGAFTTVVSTASDINASATLTLASVAAVVIGGAEFSGGIVEPVGAVMAAAALGFMPTLLYFLHVDPDYQTAVTGAILLTAMALRRLVSGGRSWLA